ncbi:MAG: signal peptidase II [Oscillospiraceae bacterium]|nr:signal peptidase II [Oscillospiraceae bacterium]
MSYIILAAAVVLVGIDQLIKYWAVTELAQVGTIPLFENILHLTYVENRGAAFSLLSGQQWLLILVTGVMLAAGIWLLLSGRLHSRFLMSSVGLVIAGGVGNLIDRVINGFRFAKPGVELSFWEHLGNSFVIDYIDFRAINFAVFNFADCCVVIGTILIAAYVLFADAQKAKLQKEKDKSPEKDTEETD